MLRRFGGRPTAPPPPAASMAQARAQKMANEAAELAAAKTKAEETEYRNAQLREGVAPANVKPMPTKLTAPALTKEQQAEMNKPVGPSPVTAVPGMPRVPGMPAPRVPGTPASGGMPSSKPVGENPRPNLLKKGGKVKSKASSRADGIAQRGKTKGRMV